MFQFQTFCYKLYETFLYYELVEKMSQHNKTATI